ncbi:oligosaccharide flippase family protein [Chloroflexota bacterium]
MSLARRSVTSASWSVAANSISMVVLFVRSVLLARLLPVDVFGVYALAGSVISLSLVTVNFGMVGAFLHRAPETQDEDQTAAVHFTLKCLLVLLWAACLVVGALAFASGQLRTSLLLLAATASGMQLAQTPRLILLRRVVHRRLALLQVINAVLTTLVAVGLAWQGVTLWALLSTDLVSLLLALVAFYAWRPVWRPRIAWSPGVVRYFLRFGSRNFLADLLSQALDRIDDLWTGILLGKTPLGYYSRAYAFATYPRKILATPINLVAGGTYAELKGDRRRLSQAFFRTNALLVRGGFFLAGLLALVAPEFIRLVIGAKWLPMLDAFRLMLVFTLLDPIKLTVADLFVAEGRPELVAQARFVQLVCLIAGLFLLGPSLGIAGVALAVDTMLIVGITLLLRQASEFVDFSLTRLFAVPGLALVLGLVLAIGAMTQLRIPGSDWLTGLLKAVVFSAAYIAVLLIWERRQLLDAVKVLTRSWSQGMQRGW